jgi:tetratricopeptide (TPR) repeat protein
VTNRPYMRAIFAYGVWLYEREQFGKAAKLFKKLLTLNPTDNQGARYVAISALAHNGNPSAAKRLLEEYKVGTENDAPYLFMKWMVERDPAMEEIDSEALLEALNANPFVIQLMQDDAPRLPYPMEASMLPGSMEEAQYIWWLL